MDNIRQKKLFDYINSLYDTGQTYNVIGRKIKYVTEFLENVEELSWRGYAAYKRIHADEMVRTIGMSDAILDFLSFSGIGRKRKSRKLKPLEKLSAISEKNQKLFNDFLTWLSENNDYSPHTLNLYRTSMKFFFEYANEFNMENCKRFISMMEERGFAPQTIRLRITAFEKFSKWLKKPLELRRPKIKKSLAVENVPTEEEYNRLLNYLSGKKNRDYYFFIRILGTTGLRLSEFSKITWEDIIRGEVVLRGKGNKYRRCFFQKSLQNEAKEYMNKESKSGLVAVSRFGHVMGSRSLAMLMKDWGDRCGIDKKKMHPHAFRHFFAKMFLKKNKDVIQLADLLGHGSVDTTRIYLQRSYDEQKRDFARNVTW